MVAAEKSDHEGVNRVHIKIVQRSGRNDPRHGWQAKDEGVGRTRSATARIVRLLRSAPPRFADCQGESGKDDTGKERDIKGSSPPIRMRNSAAEPKTQENTDRQTEHKERQCAGPLM